MPRPRLLHLVLLPVLATAPAGCVPLAPPSSSYAADVEAILGEARRFMDGYASDLARGDRAAIARRYMRGGAWFLGHGAKRFESHAQITAHYGGDQWRPPLSFEWRDLSFEAAGSDAVVVAGLALWEPAGGGPIVTISYTALLIREDGELRIRLEDESSARQP